MANELARRTIRPAAQQRSLGSVPDDGLLALIAESREADSAVAHLALAELHRRHVDFVYAVCVRLCRHYLADGTEADDLLSKTMWRAYRTAEGFDSAVAGCEGDPERARLAVRAWLAGKARFLVRERFRTQLSRPFPILPGSEVLDLHPEKGNLSTTIDGMAGDAVAALNCLSDRERHIVLVRHGLSEGDPRSGEEWVEAADDYLARRYRTSPANVRQISSRALAKLRSVLTASVEGVSE